jgi:hypothetical protein
MALFQQHFPHRLIRWCFFQIYPDVDENVILLSELNDTTGQWLQPEQPLFQNFLPEQLLPESPLAKYIADASGTLVGDSVLENESQ